MCIKNALQITYIIKEYCVLHCVALFFGRYISHLNPRK